MEEVWLTRWAFLTKKQVSNSDKPKKDLLRFFLLKKLWSMILFTKRVECKYPLLLYAHASKINATKLFITDLNP